MLGLLGLLAALPIISAWAGNNGSDESRKEKMVKSVSVIQPITGTWINLAYKDVRNKYTNPQHFDNTDPKLWTAKVRELANMGIEYLVFMEVANEGKAYYPSKLMPWVYNDKLQSPVDAILDEAARHDMKVFMSTGWAKDQDDNLLDPAIRERQLQIMEELASLYKNHKAFYGWYLPVEDCICPIFAEHAVQSVNTLTEKAKSLTPGKKTLISPYGIGLSEFDHPDFEKQMAKLKVDIIAYQDEVGCVRDKFTLPRLKKNWQRMRDIHNRLNIEMWANCETFTWEEGTNDRQSALIPAAYPRLLSQQAAASAAGVDRIISFMFGGIIEDPKSSYQLGHPVWSNDLYNNYMAWKEGDIFWKLFEAALLEALGNSATPEMIGKADMKALADGRVAEEDSGDSRWVRFEKGHHEVVIDLQKNTSLRKVLVRTLNYNQEKIGAPLKVYVYTSQDGQTYNLASIKDAPYFPNNKHDAWIDGVFFENLDERARYVKIAFDALENVYMEQVGSFGEVERDPGERVISIAYYALININEYDRELVHQHNAYWVNINELPPLIFDHPQMVKQARELMQQKASTEPIGFNLLPKLFTLSQLQSLYEAIYGEQIDKRNFRKRIAEMDYIEKTDKIDKTGSKRGAALYKFNEKAYRKAPNFKL